MMLWSRTHCSLCCPFTNANCPAHWQPLYWMHSALPGAGYEVKFVRFALFQVPLSVVAFGADDVGLSLEPHAAAKIHSQAAARGRESGRVGIRIRREYTARPAARG